MTDATGADSENRIAIVFVHGQGEQRPMEDVQEFARTMWDGDPKLKRQEDGREKYARTYTVPDPRLDGADFARVTTEAGRYSTRIDFFEFYWADLMVGNRFEHLSKWFVKLQQKPRSDAPKVFLPIRQFVIRCVESVLLLAMLFAFSTAMLLPPAPSAWSREEIGGLYAPVDHAWLLGFGAIAVMFSSWLVIVANEAGGDHLSRWWNNTLGFVLRGFRNHKTASERVDAVRSGTKRGQTLSPYVLAFLLFLLVAVIFLTIWRGPTLEWGDLRSVLFALVLIAGGIATFARPLLSTAANIAMAAAVIALVCVLSGNIDGTNLFQFTAPAADLNPALNNETGAAFDPAKLGLQPGSGNDNYLGAKAQNPTLSREASNLALALLSLEFFAAFWFIGGFLGILRLFGAKDSMGWRILLLIPTFLISAAAAWWTFDQGLADPPFRWLVFTPGIVLLMVAITVGLLGAVLVKGFLVPVMADSARYFSRDPDNVSARHQIRRRGLNLLDQLHKKQPDGRTYSRIIVIAHSLGSVVAYELLNDFWSRQCGAYLLRGTRNTSWTAEGLKMVRVMKRAKQIRQRYLAFRKAAKSEREKARDELTAARKAYRAAQGEFSASLSRCRLERTARLDPNPRGCNWLITDFITMGSPLTHASLLMADGPEDLWQMQKERKLPTCPATLDRDTDLNQTEKENDPWDNGHTFQGGDGRIRPLHSAVFSAVRWTNLYFKVDRMILGGDIIGGQVASNFGLGVRDVPLDRYDTGALFAHNDYWRSVLSTEDLQQAFAIGKGPEHLVALKKALHLDDTSTFVLDKFRPK